MTATEFQLNVIPLKDKLYRFALRMLANAEEARDTVQEVMIKVWESGKPLADYDSIEAWCMTLTRNRSLDILKVNSNRQRHLKVIKRGSDVAHMPADKVEQTQQVNYVIDEIKNLPVVQRELIELRDFQEKTYEEMCEITGLEMTQVKVYLFRARKAVREKINALNAYGIEA